MIYSELIQKTCVKEFCLSVEKKGNIKWNRQTLSMNFEKNIRL